MCSDVHALKMLSGNQYLINFGQAQPSVFCYFHKFSKFNHVYERLCKVKLLDYMAVVHFPNIYSIFSALRILPAEI